nr:hypothetical protein [Pseudomonadota bacterium]
MVANLLITTNVMGVAEADTQLGRLERTADRTERQVEQLGRATQRTATSTDRQAVSSRTATTAIRAQGQATQTAARESIRFNETTRSVAGNLRDIAIIGAVVGIGIGAGSRVIRSAVSEYLDFDRALTQVNTIARLADPALARLSSRAVEFASQYGNSSADQALGYYQIISAGITQSTRALDVWDASNRAAFAGQAELPAVISAVTTAFNNYPDAFRDAAEAT